MAKVKAGAVKGAVDPRVAELRKKFAALANAEHAAFHKEYHKSELEFLGLRVPQLRAVMKEVFPARPKLGVEEAVALTKELWVRPIYEERSAALLILQRVAKDLDAGHLPWIHSLTRDVNGWGLLDEIGVHVLGPMAMSDPEGVYPVVRKWSKDPHMWTRRASVLIHCYPARKGSVAVKYAWPTFEELLPEKEFFIRKAVGWALRELCGPCPQEVHDFLLRVGDRASGLTRREGARKLPPKLRKDVLGK
jgi:3-methyladenine DNA glycosylase AlkD